MTTTRELRFGFDSVGGFIVVDDVRRLATYSYPGSHNADLAKGDQWAAAAKIIREMRPTNGRIDEDHYQRMASILYVTDR